MSEQDTLELEIKRFIIETLNLEDITEDDIESDTVLFGEGLGLDSIDALELGVGLQKRYGVRVDPKADDTEHHFTNVRNLAKLVNAKRTQ